MAAIRDRAETNDGTGPPYNLGHSLEELRKEAVALLSGLDNLVAMVEKAGVDREESRPAVTSQSSGTKTTDADQERTLDVILSELFEAMDRLGT
jgi:hypothetical protein